MKLLYPILTILFGTFIVYGPELYILTNKMIYLIFSIISAVILIFVIYKMFYEKYTILTITLCTKIIPMIILSLIGFFIVKDQKITIVKSLALGLVILGTYLLNKK